MNLLTRDKIIKISFSLFFIKVISAIYLNFASIVTPHIHRQTDTLGVTLRYWQKFNFEVFHWTNLLPSVLNAGKHGDIMPMEFPLINLILSPFFALPFDNKLAIVMMVYLVITTGLFIINYKVWKDIQLYNVSMAIPMAILPLTSFFIDFSTKLIPDVWSSLLIFIAMGLIISSNSKRLLSFILITLGLLIKPTSITAFGLLLILDKKKVFKVSLSLIAPAVLITIFYYKFGCQFIDFFRTEKSLFAYKIHSPLELFLDFFSEGKRIFKLMNDFFLIRFGSIIVILVAAFKIFSKRDRKVLALLFIISLQLLTIILLRGGMLFAHQYYFLSFTPTLLLFSFYVLRDLNFRFLFTLIAIILVVRNFELMIHENKSILSQKNRHSRIRQQCNKLRDRNPEFPWARNFIFRSSQTPYPEIGLCFLERTSSEKSGYGLDFLSTPLPKNCTEVDRTNDIKIYRCDDFLSFR
ncbi:hypothetical protein HBN50_05550 [Halobacteriovorax sp. GB3]|uniref:hypothetical protein n=1 Tax=Halobacteriovorax sp. GB3 TaxID=2719615 RepID=UPI0023612B0F|nr:hypothetical protein [Halobacteriovorax sp. GB3]MDD0852552.1 hypothetical protein [Halobacteriovorax sp. GB3]